jgi:hypothetical protein
MTTPWGPRKKQLTLHVNDADKRLLAALLDRTGLESKSDLLRLAMRALYRDTHGGAEWSDKAAVAQGTQTGTDG